MPKYYLHVCNGDGFTQDEEGVDYPDIHAARMAAIHALREIMASEVKDGLLKTTSFIEIEDASNELLLTVTFSECVYVEEQSVRDQMRPKQPAR